MHHIREGFVLVSNPVNPSQVSYISLVPEDVDIIVFWTRNPEPLIPHLAELDTLGYRYYFLYTITGYPTILEPNVPCIDNATRTFLRLADLIGPEKVIWRYDPILITRITDIQFHRINFSRIARPLCGSCNRVIVSVYDEYRSTKRNLNTLSASNIFVEADPTDHPEFQNMIRDVVGESRACGMEITSCAEPIDLALLGVSQGKCIDDSYIRQVFGISVSTSKDPNQRRYCGCVISRDIGWYDSCQHGCVYCYANRRNSV